MYQFHAVMNVSHEAWSEITKGVLTTAVESGWGDWFSYKATRDPVDSWVLAAGVLDVEEGTLHTVVMDDIWAAMQKALDPTVKLNTEIRRDVLACVLEGDSAPLDAEGADVIIQLAVFGEIVYA